MAKQYLKVGEVADLLGVCTKTVRKYSNEERLPSLRDVNGHRKFRREEVEKFTRGYLSDEGR